MWCGSFDLHLQVLCFQAIRVPHEKLERIAGRRQDERQVADDALIVIIDIQHAVCQVEREVYKVVWTAWHSLIDPSAAIWIGWSCDHPAVARPAAANGQIAWAKRQPETLTELDSHCESEILSDGPFQYDFRWFLDIALHDQLAFVEGDIPLRCPVIGMEAVDFKWVV